ncbi:hypothetical protein M413DRAFT_319828 [Hebeloma cylindrosporum]|uniref:Uncharacterized protein n=1 Tax=Hebeloma cylindrosporum TaxID=76867 RepID=A0A0C2XEE4_HEBCY|nr:hypothetical protein M413DRAFT_319828 [Hebeloma cylindrosporum h7]
MSLEDWIPIAFDSGWVSKLVLDSDAPRDVTAPDVYLHHARIHPTPLLPVLNALTIQAPPPQTMAMSWITLRLPSTVSPPWHFLLCK